MGRRIGIFGGTFDPPHTGHLEIAREVYEKAMLDKVIFIPTGIPQYKLKEHEITDKEDRLQMLELLLRDERWTEISRMELDREGPSYTSDTVRELREMYPGDDLFLIVGSDSLKYMSEWHEPEVIFSIVGVIVILRDDDTWDSIQEVVRAYKTRYNAQIGVVDGDKYDISSTMLREKIASGEDPGTLLPERVAWYVRGRGLYAGMFSGLASGRLSYAAADDQQPAVYNSRLEYYLKNNFDPERVLGELINWIRRWFDENGRGCTAVIGLSGGKDSTMVATLCQMALGRNRVLGVLMPDHSQSDISVSQAVAQWLGISYVTVNIGDATDAVRSCIHEAEIIADPDGAELNTEMIVAPKNGRLISRNSFVESGQMLLNIPPRIRMTTLYAIAQTMNGRVSNNCNRSENYVGYSTLYGDAAGDFSPLHNLTVTEIIRLGEYMDIPYEFIHKAPSDGLSGKTDEDALGFTYEALDTYILTGVCDDPGVKELIDKRHRANEFKLRPMARFELK